MVEEVVEAFTDGACSGNPGPGGWGVVLYSSGVVNELCDGEIFTTNNRMELVAVISALDFLAPLSAITIYTDSTYVKRGVTEWLQVWKRNGWRTAAKQKVKNKDLWVRMDELCCNRLVTWRWLKGHAGHKKNERADWLAKEGMKRYISQRHTGPEFV